MRVEAFVIAQKRANRDTCYCNLHKKITSIESAADLWTWDGVILRACVDHVNHNYLYYRSVDYDDCLAQFSSKEKEEQRQAVLGLLKQKDLVTVLPAGFAKSLI